MSPSAAGRLRRFPARVQRRARRLRRDRADTRLHPSLRWDPAAAELVLSPHWDDAVLSCWSVLSSAGEVAVVNLFAGIPPEGRRGVWERIIGAADTAERSRRRTAEDGRALARAGRSPINLPLLESRFRNVPAGLGLPELDRQLGTRLDSASRVHVPAGIGSHADHLLARRYGLALLRTGMPVSLYAELPYCVFHGWPAWVTEEAQDERDVDAYWRSYLGDVPEMPPLREAHVERLDPPRARAKADAIALYECSLNFGVRRLLADPVIHAYEVRWTLAEQPPRDRAPADATS